MCIPVYTLQCCAETFWGAGVQSEKRTHQLKKVSWKKPLHDSQLLYRIYLIKINELKLMTATITTHVLLGHLLLGHPVPSPLYSMHLIQYIVVMQENIPTESFLTVCFMFSVGWFSLPFMKYFASDLAFQLNGKGTVLYAHTWWASGTYTSQCKSRCTALWAFCHHFIRVVRFPIEAHYEVWSGF